MENRKVIEWFENRSAVMPESETKEMFRMAISALEQQEKAIEEAYQQGYEQGYKDGYNEPGKGKIQVGDEVENSQTGVKFIVTHLWKNNRGEQGVSGFNQECSAFSTTLSLVVKTGRHFPEIAEVLQKMKE